MRLMSKMESKLRIFDPSTIQERGGQNVSEFCEFGLACLRSNLWYTIDGASRSRVGDQSNLHL